MTDELKSSYELAMERLRAKDREEGVEASRSLTDDDRRAIAALREEAKAKLAELEILHRKHVAAASDPAELAKLEERYLVDRRRVESSMESRIARVRRGEAPDDD